MMCLRLLGPVLIVVLVAGNPTVAQQAGAVAAASGTIDKVDKESLTIRPRGADGKFQKGIELKITGTTKITTLSTQTRAGKVVVVQRDADVKDLKPKQTIAVIYTVAGGGPVLLSAVVQPSAEK